MQRGAAVRLDQLALPEARTCTCVARWGGSRFPEILFKISLRGARRKISRNLHSLGGVPGGVMTKVTDIPSTGLQYGTPRHPASASLDTCTGLIPHTCSLLHPCRHPYTAE